MPTAVELTRIPSAEKIPYGYCHCGCGQKTNLVKKTSRKRGEFKGEPQKFLHNHRHRESLESRFWKYVDKNGQIARDGLGFCWRWNGKTNDFGYGLLGSNTVKKGAFIRAHRVSYEIHFGEIPDGMVIRHKCDNPPCCNPEHLELGTVKDNVRDSVQRGRLPVGSETVMARLTDEQVREIRIRYRVSPITMEKLASEYGVSNTAIFQVVNGRSWKHLLPASMSGERTKCPVCSRSRSSLVLKSDPSYFTGSMLLRMP